MTIVALRFRFVGPLDQDIGDLVGGPAALSVSEGNGFATWEFDDALVEPEDITEAMRGAGWELSSTPATSPTCFVYRPGGTTGGSIYADWAQLFAAYLLTDGPATIEIDDSVVSPAVIPVGTWAFRPDTVLQGSFAWNPAAIGDFVAVDITDGAVFDPPPLIIRNPIQLNSLSSAPVISFANDPGGTRVDQMTLERGARLRASGVAAFISSSRTDGILVIGLSNAGRLMQGALEILGDLGTQALATVTLTVINVSQIDDNAISSNIYGAFSAVADDSSRTSTAQASYAGLTSLDNVVRILSRRFLPSDQVYNAVTIVNYQIRSGSVVRCNPLVNGPFTLTLPPVGSVRPGDEIIVKNVTGSPSAITVTTSGVDTIDGAPSLVLATPLAAVRLQADGNSNWMVI